VRLITQSKFRSWPPEAVRARRRYARGLRRLVAGGIDCTERLPVRVLAFSSERDLPEQVASARSLLTTAGAPVELQIVSDGTHSRRSRRLLQAVHPSVSVVDWRRLARPRLPRALWDYAAASWRGKKLLVLVSLELDRPLLYTDADILFFPGAAELRRLDAAAGHRYLLDCGRGSRRFLDREMLADESEGERSINSGFIFFAGPIDWAPALRRLEQRLQNGQATFTGQTVVHLALHGAGATPFDPERYVMADDDRLQPGDPYASSERVLRHYVTPMRHKFWTTLARNSSSLG
jgi:hypothetical protein